MQESSEHAQVDIALPQEALRQTNSPPGDCSTGPASGGIARGLNRLTQHLPKDVNVEESPSAVSPERCDEVQPKISNMLAQEAQWMA